MHPLRYGMVCVCVCLCVPWHTGEFEFEYTCMHFLISARDFYNRFKFDWLATVNEAVNARFAGVFVSTYHNLRTTNGIMLTEIIFAY